MTVTIWRYDDNYSDDDDAKKLILTLATITQFSTIEDHEKHVKYRLW